MTVRIPVREYTVSAAKYANAEKTAIVISTAENADVMISEVDTPTPWRALMASDMIVADYEPPKMPEPKDAGTKLAEFLGANPDVEELIAGKRAEPAPKVVKAAKQER